MPTCADERAVGGSPGALGYSNAVRLLYCRSAHGRTAAIPIWGRRRALALSAAVFLLAGCGGSVAPAGGMGDSASSSTAATVDTGASADSADQPGFLTATPPPGGGGGPATPPPGGLEQSAVVTPAPAGTPTPSPENTASPRASASGTPGKHAGTATATPFQTPSPQPTDTPVPVDTAPAQQAIQVSMTAPAAVNRGATATIQATTNVPGAVCTLTVRYRTAGSSPAPQFPVQTADPNGNISWSWTVPQDVVPGTWPVTVRCQIGLPLNDPDASFAYATNLLPVK